MKSIRELLTGLPPVTLPPTASVLEAAKTMHEEHVGAVLVREKGSNQLGIFSERDLMARVVVAGKDPTKVTLGEVMTREIFTVEPERRINDVARELQARHIRHLPVIENGEVLCILSLRDLLREHIAVKRSEVDALKSYIQGQE